MGKKAVLIGINYPGTSVELRGCVNDVRRMQKCLIERFGFSNDDITVLIDTDNSYIQPTGKNIREALKKLIESGKSGDFLVFHYSGHGTRIPPEIGIGDSTGFDECITPCDMNLIMDHEFKEMVAHVKKGCQLTIISDSCHSGGLIEEAKEQIGESHVNPPKLGIANFFLGILMYFLPACGVQKSRGGGQEIFTREVELENGEMVDMKTRYLPLGSFICLLEQQTGETNIEFRKIRSILVKVFGQDSSPLILSNSMKRNVPRGFLSMFQGKGDVNADASRLIPDKAIFLSACQTDQRSEDVYITRTGKSYGAFSDAIQTILSSTRKEKKITNKDMVLKARELLKKRSFTQRPDQTMSFRKKERNNKTLGSITEATLSFGQASFSFNASQASLVGGYSDDVDVGESPSSTAR